MTRATMTTTTTTTTTITRQQCRSNPPVSGFQLEMQMASIDLSRSEESTSSFSPCLSSAASSFGSSGDIVEFDCDYDLELMAATPITESYDVMVVTCPPSIDETCTTQEVMMIAHHHRRPSDPIARLLLNKK